MITHPAPHRFQVGRLRTFAGLFGAPFAWLAQMSLSLMLAAYACYPHQAPLTEPQWPDLSLTIAIISLICFLAAAASGIIAWTSWRRVRQEKFHTGKTADVGEGRTRFLAMLALLTSLLFVIAILFSACAFIFVLPCRSWF
jgi:hypothetical protein